MCQDGAEFVSNTHVVADGHGTVHGVPTTLRVRDDFCFGELIRAGRLSPHIEEGEYVADPSVCFDRWLPSAKIQNVCVVDYDPARRACIEPIEEEFAYLLFEQFGFPINTYAMKDDVLEFCGGDLGQFAVVYAEMKKRLRTVVSEAQCLYVNCDMMQADHRARLRSHLSP